MQYDVIIEVEHIEAPSKEDALKIVEKELLGRYVWKFKKKHALKITDSYGECEISPCIMLHAKSSQKLTIKTIDMVHNKCVRCVEYCDGEIKEIENDEE